MLVVTQGTFGAAVGKHVASLVDATIVSFDHDKDTLSSLIGDFDFVVFSSWRGCDADLLLFDEICQSRNVTWCPVYPTGADVVCGPVVVPGESACYQCFQRRAMCHSEFPDRKMRVQRAYQNSPEVGIAGYLETQAWMAASLVATVSRDARKNGGRSVCVSSLDGEVLDSRVVPIHGCPTCAPASDAEPGERFVRSLQKWRSELR